MFQNMASEHQPAVKMIVINMVVTIQLPCLLWGCSVTLGACCI